MHMFMGQFFNQNRNFGVLWHLAVISRVQKHLINRKPLTN